MIKYTYYIDFVRRLLDLDISTIVKQNLNDYRAYPNYNLEFVCFNTISEVSMLRNNKVQIDEEFLKSLPNKEKEKYARIFLMHHTPLYVEKIWIIIRTSMDIVILMIRCMVYWKL